VATALPAVAMADIPAALPEHTADRPRMVVQAHLVGLSHWMEFVTRTTTARSGRAGPRALITSIIPTTAVTTAMEAAVVVVITVAPVVTLLVAAAVPVTLHTP